MANPSHILLDRVTILEGDVFDRLKDIPDESIDCAVFSPPYWGLRDYEADGQIGLESSLAEHLEVMVRVMREVRRVLKKTGTVWLNYGDCYATAPNGITAAETKRRGKDDRTFRDKPFSTIGGDLKPKDLCMVPNRLAIALQADGWWVRSEIIWAKPNPMPESVGDRPGVSHEKIFMLTKAQRYFYNAEAVRQTAAETSEVRWAQDIEAQAGSTRANGGTKLVKALSGPHAKRLPAGWDRGPGRHSQKRVEDDKATKTDRQRQIADARPGGNRRMAGFNERWNESEKARGSAVAGPRHKGHINHTGIEDTPRGSRGLRNYEPAPLQVWTIGTAPFSEAHFATFPPELVERCILAGCPEGGTVLDPFGGAGTTGLVAAYLGRTATLIELNPAYVAIAKRRLVGHVSRIEAGPKSRAVMPPTTDFFGED